MAAQIDHLNEQVLINNVLMGAIGESSRHMDKFSSWLVAGFAAATAVVFANLAEASSHLSPGALRTVFVCFFVVTVLGVVAKALAVLVAGASAGAAIGRVEGTRAAAAGAELDVSWFFREVERSIARPVRWAVRRLFNKVAQGDLTAGSRLFVGIAQVQAVCMAAQAVVLLVAIGVVSWCVTF